MKRFAPPSEPIIQRFTEIVGAENALRDPALQARYLKEWRDLYQGRTALVLRPASTHEVSRIMALASVEGIAVVPQAGNTGLVGGQIPYGDEIVVSVERLSRIRAIDATAMSMTVEAGVTLAGVQRAAEDCDRLFPLSLASEGSCQIGGNLATNAGGIQVLAYGNARALTLGLEAVLPDGRIWNGLSNLKKDNSGYDLKDLLIGSEGTLGIITAAALKLFPRPLQKATAFVALPSLEGSLDLFRLAQDAAGSALTAFEFLPALAMDMVLRHSPGTRRPMASTAPWFALLELSSHRDEPSATTALEQILTMAAARDVIADGVIAQSLEHAKAFWEIRERMSESQKPEGGSIKHDISVPISAIPEFIRRADRAVEGLCPGARPIPFGHMGDGNVHYNVSQPPGMDRQAFLGLWEPMSRAVHDIVVGLEGSISAEHGIGRMKREELVRLKPAVELDLMRRIKTAFDPQGIMNPGKVL